jgi:hypothetical protein
MTSIGLVRDVTNDILFTMEGSGLVGLFAYLTLIFSLLIQRPMRSQVLILRKKMREELYSPEMWEACHTQAAGYILMVSLSALFLFDCSAFSAGSILSAVFWMNAGIAVGLKGRLLKRSKGLQTLRGGPFPSPIPVLPD